MKNYYEILEVNENVSDRIIVVDTEAETDEGQEENSTSEAIMEYINENIEVAIRTRPIKVNNVLFLCLLKLLIASLNIQITSLSYLI